jgi:hypothetical protein
MIALLSLILLAGWSQLASGADDGALPRGKSKGPGVKYKIKKPEDIDPSCFDYHSNPTTGQVYYSPDGDSVFLVGKEKSLADGRHGQAYLIRLDLNNFSLRKVAGLKTSDHVVIKGHGFPVAGVSLLEFKQSTFGCGQGYSKGVAIKWSGKKQVVKTFPKSYYKLVPSDRSSQLVDRKTQFVRRFDLKSFQKLPSTALPKQGIPLYVGFGDKISFQFTLGDNDTPGTLLKYSLVEKQVKAKLKLAQNMKLVQQGELFGVVMIDPKQPYELSIKQIKGWSGSAFVAYDAGLSAPFEVDRARVVFDFTSGLAAVLGEVQAIQRDWRHALVVDGKAHKKIGMMKAPDGQYVAIATLDPKRRFFIFVTRQIDDEALGTISLYKIKERKWKQLHLNFQR